jgi:type VI secretion system protein ImpH
MEDASVGAGADVAEAATSAPPEDAPEAMEGEARKGRVPSDPDFTLVEDLLREKPTTFGFFQAVRLLERIFPDRDAVGRFVDPDDEVARFGVHPSLAFPTGEIHDLEVMEDEPSPMVVNFMGAIGPQGVLPHEYTRLVADRRRDKDHATGDFLDLFHHRILSLFYQAWRKHRFELEWEDRYREGRTTDDPLTAHLLDLVGLNPEGQRRGLGLPDDALSGYASLLAPHQRSGVALEQLISDYFGVPARVEPFVGGWYALQERDLCGIGDDSLASRLGQGAVVGDEIWDQQARVRVRLGPMDRERFETFLPTGHAYPKLRTITRLFSHEQFDFEIQLVLARDDVPGCVLGETESPQPLGWSTWVRTRDFDRDADDTTLRL